MLGIIRNSYQNIRTRTYDMLQYYQNQIPYQGVGASVGVVIIGVYVFVEIIYQYLVSKGKEDEYGPMGEGQWVGYLD